MKRIPGVVSQACSACGQGPFEARSLEAGTPIPRPRERLCRPPSCAAHVARRSSCPPPLPPRRKPSPPHPRHARGGHVRADMHKPGARIPRPCMPIPSFPCSRSLARSLSPAPQCDHANDRAHVAPQPTDMTGLLYCSPCGPSIRPESDPACPDNNATQYRGFSSWLEQGQSYFGGRRLVNPCSVSRCFSFLFVLSFPFPSSFSSPFTWFS